MKVVPQKRPPIRLRIVGPKRMKYACSSIKISIQREILSHLKTKISKIDAHEPLKLINSLREIIYTYSVVCSVVKETAVVEILSDGTCINNLPKRISPF